MEASRFLTGTHISRDDVRSRWMPRWHGGVVKIMRWRGSICNADGSAARLHAAVLVAGLAAGWQGVSSTGPNDEKSALYMLLITHKAQQRGPSLIVGRGLSPKWLGGSHLSPVSKLWHWPQPLDSKAWNDKPGVKRVLLPVWNKLYWNSHTDEVWTKGTKGLERLPLEQPFDRSYTGAEGKKMKKKIVEIF